MSQGSGRRPQGQRPLGYYRWRLWCFQFRSILIYCRPKPELDSGPRDSQLSWRNNAKRWWQNYGTAEWALYQTRLAVWRITEHLSICKEYRTHPRRRVFSLDGGKRGAFRAARNLKLCRARKTRWSEKISLTNDLVGCISEVPRS